MKSNTNLELLKAIQNMKPLEFAGLARLLGVSIINPEKDKDDKYTPRPFGDVLEDVMSKFSALNRVKKREILRLVKKSNRSQE